MYYDKQFDVIVVGGGHAGTEAAMAAARIGLQTLLLTHNIETIGQMSCNPAIGGIGKGHLVKEIDALGGVMAKAADKAGIQFRVLNASKGAAVRATRAQADRVLYKKAVREMVENQPNLSLFQQPVDDLVIEDQRVVGVITQMGLCFRAKAVVLTVGTFLAGKIHIGMMNYQGGRAGDPPASTLAAKLHDMPFRMGRLKTGTPPRIDGRTIDYTGLAAQPGDDPLPIFSFLGKISDHPQQVSCYITHTNENTHEIIKKGLDRSPLYTGEIEGVGPRYCPSIEDKIVRFAAKNSHQIFIEPEGLTTFEVYPNGISTSLPFDVQLALVRSIKGFEHAHITRPGYAIEYDYFDPRDLHYSLQSKHLAGLFLAGQINGTTGYEEAGAQGIIAGINAARYVQAQEPWCPRRDEAYIGVLIDDLITQGTLEPYRMFTSRAEYRLSLREDNADLRLTEKGRELGVVDDERWQQFVRKKEGITEQLQYLNETWVRPQTPAGENISALVGDPLTREYRLMDLLRRPEVHYDALFAALGKEPHVDEAVRQQVETQAKYQGYVARQQQEIERQVRHETTLIPAQFNFRGVSGLSNEVVEKLERIQPASLGQAARIPGVTPAAISLLLIYIKKGTAYHGQQSIG